MKHVQVLGPGCPNCETFRKNAEQAVRQAGIEATVEKVTDIEAITRFNVMATPALVIDGQVKIVGKVASADEIQRLLT